MHEEPEPLDLEAVHSGVNDLVGTNLLAEVRKTEGLFLRLVLDGLVDNRPQEHSEKEDHYPEKTLLHGRIHRKAPIAGQHA
jgi:hypothetical protein